MISYRGAIAGAGDEWLAIIHQGNSHYGNIVRSFLGCKCLAFSWAFREMKGANTLLLPQKRTTVGDSKKQGERYDSV